MGTHLEPGTFNFVTPAQHEPITTHCKKAPKFRYDHSPSAKIVSPARPPLGNSRPVMSAPPEILVEIMAYGSQKDKLAWMLVGRKFVDPAERALWLICGRKGFSKLLSMEEKKRGRLVKMISHLNVGDDLSSMYLGIWRYRSPDVQHGVHPDHIPMLPASWLIHPRLKSFRALSKGWFNDAIDNVFAALKQASGLEVIQINHHIDGNTPNAFPRLLKCLPRLRVFEAHYTSSGTLLRHLATLPAIEDLTLGGTLNYEMVHQALEVSGAFDKLEALDITIFLDATAALFQKLQKLRQLRIVLRENQTPSWQGRIQATTSALQAISTLPCLTLLHLKNLVCRDLPNGLQPLKQLSSLRKLKLDIAPVGRSLLEEHLTGVIEGLRSLPLEELDTNLEFHKVEEVNSLGRACPKLRSLYFYRWHDPEDLDTSSPPVFPNLETFQVADFRWSDHRKVRYVIILNLYRGTSFVNRICSRKYIKSWVNNLALAAPILLHFRNFNSLIVYFVRIGGVRRWLGHLRDHEKRVTFIQDLDSHKGATRKKGKRG